MILSTWSRHFVSECLLVHKFHISHVTQVMASYIVYFCWGLPLVHVLTPYHYRKWNYKLVGALLSHPVRSMNVTRALQLCVFIMSHTHLKSIYSLQLSECRTVWLNSWVFVYDLSGCQFKSRCIHLRALRTKGSMKFNDFAIIPIQFHSYLSPMNKNVSQLFFF